jgi:hypothetical protein
MCSFFLRDVYSIDINEAINHVKQILLLNDKTLNIMSIILMCAHVQI